ncbi:hypothetical protein [Streptomyces sp. RPT161]|uniref:hypothetical protein n=1 Tax=Streptomyces sp. RPT161 TaxID=3015993 RepID=UPI0022B87D4F|nr:hypothetical protein [Streptomyces sp. RPT161]
MAASSVKETTDAARQARREVDQAEARIAGGERGVTAEALHKLRDKWRHATLSAQGAAARAEQEAKQARLDGLTQIGVEVDRLVADDTTGAIQGALRDAAKAIARVRGLAGAHDARVGDLIAAAADLDVEPLAPGGPRRTSAHVAVDRESIVHKDQRVMPVRRQVEMALGLVLGGDVEAGVAEVRPVVPLRVQERPDHLLRGRGGLLVPVHGHINTHQMAQLRSGDLVELGQRDIDRWMSGELA